MNNRGPFVSPRTYLDGKFLDDLETWTVLYDPSAVEVVFLNPDHALDQTLTRVTVLDKSRKKMNCFFKGFEAGAPEARYKES